MPKTDTISDPSKTPKTSSAAPKKSARISDSNAQNEIEALAYQFFVERGYEHGYDQEDWARAEAIVRARKNA